MIDPGTAADLQRRQMEALRELPRVQAELAEARAELALLRAEQQRLEDTLRLAELALAAVVTMFDVPVSLMGGEAFSIDGGAVNQARMALVKVNQERECRGSRRALRASGWQAPGEGEVAG